jgi:hypothetical protein
MFDILLSTASGEVLRAYPEILLVGDITFDDSFVNALTSAIKAGSRLILATEHANGLGAKRVARLKQFGEVVLLTEEINPSTKRPVAISNELLHKIRLKQMPVDIGGDSIQYQINRNALGWVVEFINNNGIVKAPHTPAIVDPRAAAHVQVRTPLETFEAYDWLSQERFDAADVPWTVIVPPGEIRFIQLRKPTSHRSRRGRLPLPCERLP